MADSTKIKDTKGGLVEIKETSFGSGQYGLYVNGELKQQSKDLSYINDQYNKK